MWIYVFIGLMVIAFMTLLLGLMLLYDYLSGRMTIRTIEANNRQIADAQAYHAAMREHFGMEEAVRQARFKSEAPAHARFRVIDGGR